MPTFTLYAVLRADHELDDAVVDTVARALGPEDDELCVWRNEHGRLIVSTDCPAGDLEEALSQGHVLAEKVRVLSRGATSVEEVQAMTDDEVLVWRAEP